MPDDALTLASANETPPLLADDAVEVLAGLTAAQKRISPKYFYDQRGSELFDEICELPEYYPTRTELAIMRRHLPEIAELVGPQAAVIEFGAGSSLKIRQLLDHLIQPAAYVPVDISGDYLADQADALAADYPRLQIQPVLADFTRPFDLPRHPVEPRRNLVFFPGSTIGNFSRTQARELLEVMRVEASEDGCALIGVDLKKDPGILHAAYNDSRGVTAKFNLNVLRRLNRELGADFDLGAFRHDAVWDEDEGRIEMRLISEREQQVTIAGTVIGFRAHEFIITEHSHKYGLEEFRRLAAQAGFDGPHAWVDEQQLFSVHYLVPRRS
jgi:L-histidine Nalpha-methyltransferase